eukprot:1255753-Alexandrium_andersonii.AAC.1
MVRQGWVVRCDDVHHLREQLGARDFPINRLALISKLRPGNTMKHRVPWGLRRSLVNWLARPGEGVVLPRLSDIIADAVDHLREFGAGQASFLGTGVADAFHRAPLSPDEYSFAVAFIDG